MTIIVIMASYIWYRFRPLLKSDPSYILGLFFFLTKGGTQPNNHLASEFVLYSRVSVRNIASLRFGTCPPPSSVPLPDKERKWSHPVLVQLSTIFV